MKLPIKFVVEFNSNPTDRQLRQFGAISAVALPIFGWLWFRNSPSMMQVVSGLGLVGLAMAVVGWFFPQALKLPFVGLSAVSYPVGIVVGELALVVVYLVVFLPIGLAFRLMHRDRLQLQFDRSAETYWRSKKQPAGAASYYRQS